MAPVSMTVNGKVRKGNVDPRVLLVHFLREQLRLTGTHIGCDTSQCGACTVLIDGRSAKSCTIFAVQADGSPITTIEGLAPDGQLHPLQEGFWEEHGLQCGYCTPGMIMAAVTLLQGQSEAVGAGDPRGDLRQLLPLHRLPAHRQRHSARREQEVSHAPRLPCCRSSWASASSGARIRVSFRAVPRTSTTSPSSACSIWRSSAATSRTAGSAPSIRVPRRRWTASKRSSPAPRSRNSWRRCPSARRSLPPTIVRSPWTPSATGASRSRSSWRAIATLRGMPPMPSSCLMTRCRRSWISNWR